MMSKDGEDPPIPGGKVREKVSPLTTDEAVRALRAQPGNSELYIADMIYLLTSGYVQAGKTDRGALHSRITTAGYGWLKQQEARQRLVTLLRGIEAGL